MRRGLGKNLGYGYYNLIIIDPYVHSLSARGIKSYPVNISVKERSLAFSDGSVETVPFVEPMRPLATIQIPVGEQWIAELKKDGALALAYFKNGKAGFINRRGVDKTFIYPELTDDEPKRIGTKGMTILQGEIIAGDGTLDSFPNLLKRDLLQDRNKARSRMREIPVKFYVFDVLMKDGDWVTEQSYEKRRKMLENIVTKDLKDYRLAEQSANTTEFTEKALKGDWEGVVYKNRHSQYVSGKLPFWLKKKFVTQADTVVLGYEKGKGRREDIGKINVGIFNPKTKRIEEVAKVGTGFSDVQLSDIKKRIEGGEKLYAVVEYLNKTESGKLRNPSFKGIRKDITIKDTHY